ncbi:hypothetical protein RJT34_09396 [Clitoria ternatea]|uniref:Uncharacterized protein n=1 Tax=Clitoria ternatea TaxID=43366 RepID=A0AAN9PUL7_CLITE
MEFLSLLPLVVLSGRKIKPSLAVYVAFGGPLDQYSMKHPKKLFERPIECCHVDSQNKQVLEQHLVCSYSVLQLEEVNRAHDLMTLIIQFPVLLLVA